MRCFLVIWFWLSHEKHTSIPVDKIGISSFSKLIIWRINGTGSAVFGILSYVHVHVTKSEQQIVPEELAHLRLIMQAVMTSSVKSDIINYKCFISQKQFNSVSPRAVFIRHGQQVISEELSHFRVFWVYFTFSFIDTQGHKT